MQRLDRPGAGARDRGRLSPPRTTPHHDDRDGVSHRLRLSLDGEAEGDDHPPGILLLVVDHRTVPGVDGGAAEHEEDGRMARPGGLGALGLELLARQARERLVLGGRAGAARSRGTG